MVKLRSFPYILLFFRGFDIEGILEAKLDLAQLHILHRFETTYRIFDLLAIQGASPTSQYFLKTTILYKKYLLSRKSIEAILRNAGITQLTSTCLA